MQASQGLARVTIVLNEPQDPVNIGSVVRAMKNMGLNRLHLVRPADFDAYRIEGVAHTGFDIIESTACFDDLRSAIAHCNLVIGTTARGRRVQRSYLKPRQAAQEILATTGAGGEAALVFGREDRGLHNADLDLCARIAVIPTEPDHSSINLAQAVMILAYELFTTSAGETPFKKPRLESLAASSEELDDLYWEIEECLHAIDFFKSHKVVSIMRTVREAGARANLDSREVALFRAMAAEVRK